MLFLFPESFFEFNFFKSIDMKKRLSSWPVTNPGNMCNTALKKCDFHITRCLQGDLPDGQVGQYTYSPNVGKNNM